jgi:glutamate dehydrogenase (NAD(P)+)
MDTYSMHAGFTVPGVVTGKPTSLGGSEGRLEATARGTVFCIIEAARHNGIELPGARVAVQGFGNAGSIAAKLISEEGSKVVAVSDSTGGIHQPDGLDVARVIAWKSEHGTVQGFPGAKDISNAEVLEVDCDILIPAALENQITAANAGNIKAKIIAEAANGPTTPEADEILFKSWKTFMIPDILCNAGGVTVSYFEWLKNLSHVRFGRMEKRSQEAAERRTLNAIEAATGRKFSDEERGRFVRGDDELTLVNSGLEDTMAIAYDQLRETRRRDPKIPDLRTAAFVSAIDKIARSYIELGIFP